MPIIDGVEYPYTPKGREAARAAAVKVAKKKSEAKRKPLKRRSTEERHKRLLKKDRTYNEREDRLDPGIAGRAMVVDELKGTKDPGSVELKARQYLKLQRERSRGESLRGRGLKTKRVPFTEKDAAKTSRGYEHDPRGAPPEGWGRRKKDQI